MATSAVHALPDPPFYAPFRHGRYDVAPGLTRFGKDGRAGGADGIVFQFDRSFAKFRAAKLASRERGFGRYVCAHELDPMVAKGVASFVIGRLEREHPAHFRGSCEGDRRVLDCRLTGERLHFDGEMRLIVTENARGVGPAYADALDVLACQVQEDLAIVSTAGERHWLSYAHVCLPNGWAPAEKVGQSFAAIHEPVAGMAEMNRRGGEFARVMTGATEGLVRFAWGVTFDDTLDHHPDAPRAAFDPASARAFVRVERQTIWGFRAVGAALFTIRTYLYDADLLRRDPVIGPALVSALRSMSPASRAYKGLDASFDALVAWLDRGRIDRRGNSHSGRSSRSS